MTDLPGIELFVGSEKAVENTAKWRDAVESAAQAVERIGVVADKLTATLDRVGATAQATSDPLKQIGGGAASIGRQVGEGGDAAKKFEQRLRELQRAVTSGTTAQSSFAAAGRGTAAVLRGLQASPAARVIGDVASALGGASVASRAFSAALGGAPLGAFIALAGSAATALLLVGNQSDDTTKKFKRLTEEAREAESAARRFDELRLAIQAGERGAGDTLVATLKRDLIEINDLLRQGVKEVPAERVLAAIEQRAPETVSALRKVLSEITELGKVGAAATPALRQQFRELATEIDDRFGVSIESVGEKIGGFFATIEGVSGGTAVKAFTVQAGQAARAVGQAYDALTGKINAAKAATEAQRKALQDLEAGRLPKDQQEAKTRTNPDRERVDAVQELLTLRARETELLGQTEEAQKRIKLVQEAFAAAEKEKRQLYLFEVGVLGAILAKRQQINEASDEKKRSDSVREVLDGLKRENELLQQEGVARQALQRSFEVDIALSKIKGKVTEDERSALDEQLRIHRDLLEVESRRKNQEGRQEGATRELAEEEEMLRRVGAEREAYRVQIEAENDARQAGLKLGSAEFQSYVTRRKAIAELTEAQRKLGDAGRQAGELVGSGLERLIFDGERARDVIRSLAEDLGRLLFRQNVTNNLAGLLSSLGQRIAGGVAAPSSGPPAGTTVTTNPFTGLSQSNAPNLRGGVIPAMGGQVVDDFGVMRRGQRSFSVAEGGATTPEAIFPLARDDRGRLGVLGAGGGGGDRISMVFPSVRTQQDARAMRATIGQQIRQLREQDRRGRRGLRPQEYQ